MEGRKQAIDCRKNWKEINDVELFIVSPLHRTMETAALEIVTNGLLKAEVTISNCWEK